MTRAISILSEKTPFSRERLNISFKGTTIILYGIIRSAGSAQLCVPRHNLECYGRRSFSCAGPVLWNSLPESMRMADLLNSFKSQLKTHYFKIAYNLSDFIHNIIFICYF